MTGQLGWDDVDIALLGAETDVRVNRVRADGVREVAIIGMSGSAGSAEDLTAFWAMLCEGRSGATGLSEERKSDLEAYLRACGIDTPPDPERYIPGSRLRSIAEFDPRFFGISRQEAKLLDPNQRLFLQAAWAALEDAGQMSGGLSGERVGVYVGLSTDFGVDYRSIVQTCAPDAPDVGVSGNIKSLMASRIAFLLDFTGPAMVVDTACSSGLVAVYMAMRAIQSGECSMAVVGGVKCDLVPLVSDGSGVGIKEISNIESSDHRTRTFDRSSDGTNAAEGVFAFVLKDLAAARRDGDHVHAVIMGGAINQNGASSGITAPNADAQADLIDAALADAGVAAEDISYIEAHGTGTRLGDPIEVSGITRAFSRHTEQRQFCAIGTVKTNIGHMDCVAGFAGLAKLSLALRERILPANLYFHEPNAFIDFSQTPVYVQDRLSPWHGSTGAEGVLYAGVSAFGLSGTNCHLILRSPDPIPQRDTLESTARILPLSAPNADGLLRLATRYHEHLLVHDVHPDDLMFTASVGRTHHRHRVAFAYERVEDLCRLLADFLAGSTSDEAGSPGDICQGEVRVVLDPADKRGSQDVTVAERRARDAEANLLLAPSNDLATMRRVARLYADGAEIDWDRGVAPGARRIPLPTYPFERTRCWVDAPVPAGEGLMTEAEMFQTVGQDVLICRLSPRRHWELDQHRIQDVAVLPGTAFVELMVTALRRALPTSSAVLLRTIVFQVPLAVQDGDEAEVHVVTRHRGETAEIVVAVRDDSSGTWVEHARAEVALGSGVVEGGHLDLDGIRARLTRVVSSAEIDITDRANGLAVGDRWSGSIRGAVADEVCDEILYALELPEQYHEEVANYCLHPALLDTLMNAASSLYDPSRLYLPLSYGSLTVHRALPSRVNAHYRKRSDSIDGQMYAFDIVVCDDDGDVVLTVENYAIRSADALDLGDASQPGHVPALRPAPKPSRSRGAEGSVLLWGDFGASGPALESALTERGFTLVRGGLGDDPAELEGGTPGLAIVAPAAWDAVLDEAALSGGVAAARAFLAATSGQGVTFDRGIIVATKDGHGARPEQAAVLGLMRVAALEFAGLKVRCVDLDRDTGVDVLADEAGATDRPALVCYAAGIAYESGLEACPVPESVPGRPVLGAGAVIVSGGTGGLGREVVRRLEALGAEHVVVVGSTEPDSSSGEPKPGASNEVVRIDMGDARAVRDLVTQTRQRYGRVAGVVHLAGRAGAGYLVTKTDKTFARVFDPKALGALHLHDATREEELGFFIAFSSVSAVEPEMGQSDYTAANMALDGLMRLRREQGLPGVSLQWPAWRETGMAVRWDAVDEDGTFVPVGTEEALDLLERILAWDEVPPVLMPGRLKQSRPSRESRTSTVSGTGAVVLYGLDHVGDIEQSVAEIWAQTLDLVEIEADDDFAALGGSSLLTTHMLRLFEERFPGVMDITDLFRHTTVAAQAEHVRQHLGVPQLDAPEPPVASVDSGGELDHLLDLLEQGDITVEQLQSF
jgi:predicted polyketide synthase